MKHTMIKIASVISIAFALLASFAISSVSPQASKTVKLQILLDRAQFSPGEIDGRGGSNTDRALAAFQDIHGLPTTNSVDDETLKALGADQAELFDQYTITAEDVKGPFAEYIPEEMMEKTKLNALNYTSPLEKICEKFHVSPEVLKQLNPDSQFSEGETITVPAVGVNTNEPQAKAADMKIFVSQENSNLAVRDASGKVIFYAPVTAGSVHEPLPLGTWKVTNIIKNPTFFYDPKLFWAPEPTDTKGKIAPGPNNPVGVVWIDLSAPHYGLHGTPEPSKIGHSESNGCVRLTNWDAQKVASMARAGTEVIFQ